MTPSEFERAVLDACRRGSRYPDIVAVAVSVGGAAMGAAYADTAILAGGLLAALGVSLGSALTRAATVDQARRVTRAWAVDIADRHLEADALAPYVVSDPT